MRTTALGKRFQDVGDVPTGTMTELAIEGKNYLRFRRAGGMTIKGQVPLTAEIHKQILKDMLWVREGSKLGIHRTVQWEFAGAPPSHELAAMLQKWRIAYVE